MSVRSDKRTNGDNPLEVQGLETRYGQTPILGGIDLSLEEGELIVMLGASGSGKTTLLRAIAGLVTPDSGLIRVGGVDVTRGGLDIVPVERRRVGFVFQDYALFPTMTVSDNIRFGLPPNASTDRPDEVLKLVGMSAYGNRLPAELSGGQQQRVALARSLAPRPCLLLLDEPFANVDLSRRRSLGGDLRQTLGNEGMSTLMVTHDPDTAMTLADRLAVLVADTTGGTVAQYDRPERIYRQPLSREIAELLGTASFVRATAEGLQATGPLGSVELINESHGAVDLLLRPEDVDFAPGPGPVRVRSASFYGRGYRVSLETPAGEIEADATTADSRTGRVTLRGPVWAIPVT